MLYAGLTEGLRFISKPTPVVACSLKQISMYCCMTKFDRIQWFKFENNVWLHLEESYDYRRYVCSFVFAYNHIASLYGVYGAYIADVSFSPLVASLC